MSQKAGTVQIGPYLRATKTLIKEFTSRSCHLDLQFKCDDGVHRAHKLMLAAQSKFLKGLLEDQEDQDVAEIVLPGIKLEHFKPAIKFMYTGKLAVTKSQIYKNYLVWYVKKILTEVLHIDANLNLGSLQLEAPPGEEDNEEKGGPQDPPDDSSAGGGGSPPRLAVISNNHPTESTNNDSSSTSVLNSGLCTSSGKISAAQSATGLQAENSGPNIGSESESTHDIFGQNDCHTSGPDPGAEHSTRELADSWLNDLNHSEVLDEQSEEKTLDERMMVRSIRASIDSEVEVLDTPRVPTPDIVDLLDSDNEENVESTKTDFGASGNTEDINCDSFQTANSSLFRQTDKTNEDSDDPGPSPEVGSVVEAISPSMRLGKKRGRKPKKRGRPPKMRRYTSPTLVEDILPAEKVKKELECPVAKKTMPSQSSDESSNLVELPSYNKNVDQIVYRGKVINKCDLPKPSSTVSKGIRKHNHNAWTLTGLKKASSLVAVKEEKAVHPCKECDAVFQKYRSLQVHEQRRHSKKLCRCPECGKMLCSQSAIKKHLLTHRPESEWPYECPLCKKKFQARADIPKHLKSRLHEDDDLPEFKSEAWFELLYPEKKDKAKELIVKVEKRKEKEREKLSNLPKIMNVTVEEYDCWDPTIPDGAQPTATGAAQPTSGNSSTIGADRNSSDDTVKRTRRIAAEVASSNLSDWAERDEL